MSSLHWHINLHRLPVVVINVFNLPKSPPVIFQLWDMPQMGLLMHMLEPPPHMNKTTTTYQAHRLLLVSMPPLS